ncbi:MAG TPA: hypothetical protein VFJ82_22470 [Longimicrobium sp.]|nr:hypothetical protein [Longimicrobium sp.]
MTSPTAPDTPPDGAPPAPAQPPAREPAASPVRGVPPPAEAVEMGGEAPCQLPRFWDVEE